MQETARRRPCSYGLPYGGSRRWAASGCSCPRSGTGQADSFRLPGPVRIILQTDFWIYIESLSPNSEWKQAFQFSGQFYYTHIYKNSFQFPYDMLYYLQICILRCTIIDVSPFYGIVTAAWMPAWLKNGKSLLKGRQEPDRKLIFPHSR